MRNAINHDSRTFKTTKVDPNKVKGDGNGTSYYIMYGWTSSYEIIKSKRNLNIRK